jgi:hypothetical protein
MAEKCNNRRMSSVGGCTGGRRGRPQRLRDDPTPLPAPTIAVENRIGWLLATTRILHPDEALRHGDDFAARALARGLHVDRSRISRWESGTTAAGCEVIGAYESLLGRPPGSLTAVADWLRRVFGDAASRPHHVPRGSAGGVDALLDVALGGEGLTGHQWQQLAQRLTSYDALFLRRDDWEDLTTRLVAELGRATGTAYVRRFDAAARLIRHPSSQRHVSRALGRYVMEPDAQVVLPVLSLLTEVHDASAGTLVLRMMAEDDGRLREAAASVAAVKLRQGVLPEAGLHRLEQYAADRLRGAEPFDRALDAYDVAMQLPLPSFQWVLHQLPDRRFREQLNRSRSSGELVTSQQAATVAADLATAVQADETEFPRHHEPDLMLRRLLRESLFHVHKSRRFHAALLLAASPYRDPVSRQLQEMTGRSHAFLAARAWTVLMRVGHAGRGADVLQRAVGETRPALRSRALVSLGLDDLELPTDPARALVAPLSPRDRESVRHGTLFALGMSGSALLEELGGHESAEVRRAARWWQVHGPAIHEP